MVNIYLKNTFAKRQLFFICVVGFTASAILTSTVIYLRNKFIVQREGFDFQKGLNESVAGPKSNEIVDLSMFKTKDGKTLASSVTNNRPIMIVLIDPHCGACKRATDQMLEVKEQISEYGINHYVVMIAKKEEATKYYDYANTLALGSEAYVGIIAENQPPKSLREMVVPSHLLLDSKGVVLKTWVGTNQDKVIRQKMAYQIVYDTKSFASR
jgi:hypothetical protein